MTKKSFAFQYIVLNLVKQTIIIDGDNSIESFNNLNNFSKEKILLLPFFVTIGNGSRKELLSLFDKFTPTTFGIIDEEIESIVDEIFKFDQHQLILTHEDNNSLVNKIDELKIIIPDFFEKIDKSILHLNFRFKTFSNLDFNTLSHWSKNNLSWEIFYKLFENAQALGDKEALDQLSVLFRDNILNENFFLAPAVANKV